MPPTREGMTKGEYPTARPRVAALVRRGSVVATLTLLLAFALVPPAGAHGDEESEEGYLLIQQALGHLAHDTSHVGIDLAMEKVEDALATEDQEGVDVAMVEQAMSALESHQVDRARVLLQESIKDAVGELPPATGGDTGTKVIVPALPGRDSLAARDWWFLGASVLCLLAGLAMAYRFRPADTIGDLRRRLAGGS